jgi:tetratricopeptide (TPR) repeat protein
MVNAKLYKAEIKVIEQQLTVAQDNVSRISLLERLTEYYIYTDINKAKKYLADFFEAIQHAEKQDYLYKYYILRGNYQNQLYFFEEAANSYSDALSALRSYGDVGQMIELYLDSVSVAINLSEIVLAEDFLAKSLKYLEIKPEKTLIARYKMLYGQLFLAKTYYDKAIELFLDAEKIFESTTPVEKTLKDYYLMSHLYSGLGTVYEITEQPEKRIQNGLKAVEICEIFGLNSRLSFYYNNVGSAYFNDQQLEQAKIYFWKAVQSADEYSLKAKAHAYANIGRCNSLVGEFENALEYYEIAQSYYEEKGDEEISNLSIIDSFIGEMYLDMGKEKKGLKQYLKAFQKAEKAMDLRQSLSVSKQISELYALQYDYKNAFEFQKKYELMLENFNEQLNERKIKEIEIIYETEKKERESEMLRLQSTQLQHKALRAQMNPHFMYNALNAIQHYIVNNDSDLAGLYLSKFSTLMRSSLDFSESEIISLEDELNFIKDYLELNQKLRFENRMNFEIIVDEEIEEDIIGVPTMIIQPYVENAIEHGIRYKKGGTIIIEFSYFDDNNLRCVIKDDGVGREKSRQLREEKAIMRQHKSRGTFITEDRLKLLQKDRIPEKDIIKIEDIIDPVTGEVNGTIVQILIPIQEVSMI